ncbi:hypothetical protein AGOR_G00214520 [Albula goreensis]|uniref:Integrin beta n=1 Tax=Albula goreensis TaxID=1534307 RepID=A0A8T3CIH5_9TELE|nr:hypothetical protein AGOR_G00214520 [Albula goreensis]
MVSTLSEGEEGNCIAVISEMSQLLILLLQIVLLLRSACSLEECPKTVVHSCDDCIRAGPFCVWCKQTNFTKRGQPNAVRCDTKASLIKSGCEPKSIISPTSYHLEDGRPLSKGTQGQPVQLYPQEVRLVLRPGTPYTFPITFKRAEHYPVDLYYLMDLSFSMKDDLENVKSLGEHLLKTLKKITSQARIGFGAFVDKTVLPFTNTNPAKLKHPCPNDEKYCQPAFGYRHVLSMTDDTEKFKKSVSSQYVSGNLDVPEGSLDAIMQAAVCGDEIGWGNSTRLLILTTDAGFHMAGDGKLGSILLPNDCKCHIDKDKMYSKNNDQDYPSIGQVARKLAENNIQPIFAVTKNVESIYQKLKELIPKSEVGVLSNDSSNVVSLIENAYKSLSSKVIVTHEELPQHVKVTYTSDCTNGDQPSSRGVCDKVRINQKVKFYVTVKADECMDSKSFLISALGFREKINVTVTTRCKCECDERQTENHEYCNRQGNLTCGICSCNSDNVGQRCECKLGGRDESILRAECQRDNGTECSGLGECICGVCNCHASEDGRKIYGRYCECDDRSCNVYQNKLCGGNGQCDCGTCKCNPDYEGNACQCKKSTEACMKDNSVCSGRGSCRCNRCQCEEGYKPPFCEECPGCPPPCMDAASCIECLGFQTGPFSKNCSESCTHIQPNVTKDKLNTKGMTGGSAGWACKEKDTSNCWMIFNMKQVHGFNKYMAFIQSERECPEPPNFGAIIGGSFAGVALIGLIMILIFRGLVYVNDLRIWREHQKELNCKQWGQNNEMFVPSTTTVKNPFYTGDS